MNKDSISNQIDSIVEQYSDWRGDTLRQLVSIVRSADPSLIEEIKWRMPSRPEGLPVWSKGRIVCIVQVFKNDVKLVFFKGVQMSDPDKLFNARMKSKTDRAIEFREGDTINEISIKAMVSEAVSLDSDSINRHELDK